jgi:hypothetical protein
MGNFTGGIFSQGRFLLKGFFQGGDKIWGISSGGDFYPMSSGTLNLQNHHILSNAT